MRYLGVFAAGLLALTALSAPAQAQPDRPGYHHVERHRWHNERRWHRHHGQRVCRTEWHHHHRVRNCWWR